MLLSRVRGAEMGHLVETKWCGYVPAAETCLLRFDDEADVIAAVLQDRGSASHEAIRDFRQDGHASWPGGSRVILELVDLVAGGGSEQLSENHVAGSKHVDGKMGRLKRGPASVVRLRKPYRVAGWVDAALTVESDQATGSITA